MIKIFKEIRKGKKGNKNTTRFPLVCSCNCTDSGLLVEKICEAASGSLGKFIEIICICHTTQFYQPSFNSVMN